MSVSEMKRKCFVTEVPKLDSSAWCFFSVIPQLDSIDLYSLCGPVISWTVWGCLACSKFSGGFALVISPWKESQRQSWGFMFESTVDHLDENLNPFGDKQEHVHAHSIQASHIPSQTMNFLACSHIMFMFCETHTRVVQWVAQCAAETTAVRISAVAHERLLWQTVTGPTSLSLRLSFLRLSFFILSVPSSPLPFPKCASHSKALYCQDR